MRPSSIATVTVAVLAAFVAALGCTSTSTTSSAATGGDGGAGGGPDATTTAPLSCTGVFDCTTPCADTDSACVDACVARATPPAKVAVENLVTCVQTNGCQGGPCFQAKCPTELAACLSADGSAAGTPLMGAAPKGSVPSDLVGTWQSFGELYEFLADGTTTRVVKVKLSGCETELFERGTAVVTGNDLQISYVTQAIKYCGSTEKPQPYEPKTVAFTYAIESTNVGPSLKLTAVPCASPGYCTRGFDRQ